jgi:hypothetical protein
MEALHLDCPRSKGYLPKRVRKEHQRKKPEAKGRSFCERPVRVAYALSELI